MGQYSDGFEKFFFKVIIPLISIFLISWVIVGSGYFAVTSGDDISRLGIWGWILEDRSNWQALSAFAYLIAIVWFSSTLKGWYLNWIYGDRKEEVDTVAENNRTGGDVALDLVLFLLLLVFPIVLSWYIFRR